MNNIDKSLLWAKQKCYEYSNKPYRLLVKKLKPRLFTLFLIFFSNQMVYLYAAPRLCLRSLQTFIANAKTALPLKPMSLFHKRPLTHFLQISICLNCPLLICISLMLTSLWRSWQMLPNMYLHINLLVQMGFLIPITTSSSIYWLLT